MTEKKDDNNNNTDIMEQAIDKAKPILAKLGFGAIVGYCSGMALKKIGKAVAFCIGLGFITVQAAVSSGYIEVDWNKVQKDVVSSVDTNADGALDAEDVKAYWRKVRTVLAKGIPDAGGFSLGFFWGVKYG